MSTVRTTPTAVDTHLEALLKVLVLLEESSVVDNGLGIGDFELHDLVVHCLGRLDRADRLLEIRVEGP